MEKHLNKVIVLLLLGLLFYSCQDQIIPENEINESPQLPSQTFDYTSVMSKIEDARLPETLTILGQGNFPSGPVTFPGNSGCCDTFSGPEVRVENDDIATLGRVLFYDKKLSQNNSIACASCHQQNKGFADNEKLSEGFGGRKTIRNSMSIVNPIMSNSFFWDSRESSLVNLSLEPILNHIEMGMENTDILKSKLSQEQYYEDLFTKAYGTDQITDQKIADAMSQFVASIFTSESRFDAGLDREFSNLTPLERHGMALFFSDKTQCSTCHAGFNFSAPDGVGNEYQQTSGTANIGLDITYEDEGRNDGLFKIPSLRNIALTAPYMHDGRFENLREVLNHYNTGIKPHTDLDDKFIAGGSPINMNLNDTELDALEAFLNTLTSTSLAVEEKWSNPFQY